MPDNTTIALAGNPNSGKTTLFNALTGSHQHVGNWPGVTVERKEGLCRFENYLVKVVDLPGVYSLTAYSPDEIIARNFIADGYPDVVVNIVDASNLERNLYLTLQILEMGTPCVIALNMMDEVERSGQHIDVSALAQEIDASVIPIVASRGQGIKNLLKTISEVAERKPAPNFSINYGEEVETEIARLEKLIALNPAQPPYPLRWTAIKLLEDDTEVKTKFRPDAPGSDIILQAQTESLRHLQSIYHDAAGTIIADARYGFIAGLIKDILKKPPADRVSLSDKIDRIVVNRWLGIPLFLLIMLGIFQFIFTLSPPLMDLLNNFFGWLASLAAGLSPAWLKSLLVDGILGGVGTVLSFIPPVFLLFIVISILEDCGYMSRAAFVMDKLMHHIGLHGRSFIPMVLGFGCSIPAIMACRTIENPRDRLTTILITPFMSCSARLPIYILLASAFFPGNQGLVVFSLYLLGIAMGLIVALILRKRIFRGESSHFVMELPPYRLPTLKSVLVHTWQRGKSFLQRAGTVILGAVVIVWLLGSLPWGVEYASAESWMGQLGRFIAPLLAPTGFGQWQSAVSLIFGFLAKEVVVGTMGSIFGVENALLGVNLATQLGWTPLVAYGFMVFCLLYLPCAAAIATIKAETGRWKWAIVSAIYTTGIAWIAATLIFQVGSLFV